MSALPDLRLPAPRQTIKMDLSAIMKEILAEAPVHTTRSTGAIPPDPFQGRPASPAPVVAPIFEMADLEDLYHRLCTGLSMGQQINTMQWKALRGAGFALAIGGLVEGETKTVLRFFNRVCARARAHFAGDGNGRLTPAQLKVLAQVLAIFAARAGRAI